MWGKGACNPFFFFSSVFFFVFPFFYRSKGTEIFTALFKAREFEMEKESMVRLGKHFQDLDETEFLQLNRGGGCEDSAKKVRKHVHRLQLDASKQFLFKLPRQNHRCGLIFPQCWPHEHIVKAEERNAKAEPMKYALGNLRSLRSPDDFQKGVLPLKQTLKYVNALPAMKEKLVVEEAAKKKPQAQAMAKCKTAIEMGTPSCHLVVIVAIVATCSVPSVVATATVVMLVLVLGFNAADTVKVLLADESKSIKMKASSKDAVTESDVETLTEATAPGSYLLAATASLKIQGALQVQDMPRACETNVTLLCCVFSNLCSFSLFLTPASSQRPWCWSCDATLGRTRKPNNTDVFKRVMVSKKETHIIAHVPPVSNIATHLLISSISTDLVTLLKKNMKTFRTLKEGQFVFEGQRKFVFIERFVKVQVTTCELIVAVTLSQSCAWNGFGVKTGSINRHKEIINSTNFQKRS